MVHTNIENGVLTNCGPTGGDVRGPVVAELGNDNSDSDHAGSHDNGTNLKHRLATNAINNKLRHN